MAKMMGNENIKRLTYDQATEQRRLDVYAYHQGANVFVAYGNLNNAKFWRIGSEQCLNMNRDRDCWVSLGEYAEHNLSLIPLFYVKTQSIKDYDHVPTPSLITYDGEEYCLKWILREPIAARNVELWQMLQAMLARRFCKGIDFGEQDNFVDKHKNVYEMLRVPGFLNTRTGQDTQVIFSSGLTYDVLEIALKLELSKHEAEHYRRIKEITLGYPLKSAKAKRRKGKITLEPMVLDETFVVTMLKALGTHHAQRDTDTFVYTTRKNTEKHDRKDRNSYDDCYAPKMLEKLVRRSEITTCDFWATAAEFHISFIKLKQTQVTRTNENGKTHTETRRKSYRREKWADEIQLNFLVLDFTKSELDHIPTINEAQELINKRCQDCNLPKPIIVDTGDNGELLELRWPWTDTIKNCGEREDYNIRFPKFNRLFDAMQNRLFELFWDFGADEKQLSVTTMLRVVGTPNTKTGNISRVVCEAEEILSHKDFCKRLGVSLIASKPKPAPRPSLDEEVEKAMREAEEDYKREISGEKVEKKQALTDDLSRLHPGSENWVCICTENKSKGDCGEWRNHWTPANRVHEKLDDLRREIADFDEYNVFVSQLEFFRTCRKVEAVAAFRACFIDIDGKITGKDLTADEWRDLVLKYCREKGILMPSELVFSGNGVHIKYFFTRYMYRQDFPRWEKLEEKLFEMFKEIGADSKSTDGARVLRIEGTRNNKPDTKDRDVRVIFEGENYTFEDFAREVEAFQIQVAESVQTTTDTKERKIQQNKKEKFSKIKEISKASAAAKLTKVEKPILGSWFFVRDEKKYDTGCSWHTQWVTKSNLFKHLQTIDKDRRVYCSIVERSQQKNSSAVRNLYLNYVVLTNCPGDTLEAKIANIMKRCQEYRGREIAEPNKIIEDGNKLILIWRYAEALPGKALSRWVLTQECLDRHFQDFGARIDSAQKTKILLPLPGYASVKTVYKNKELKYLFDRIACDVLPFSQVEVSEYKATKKTHSLRFEPLTQEYVTRREAEGRKSRFNPALKIFNDIEKLLRLRAANSENGEVPQGHRELCVFYALNFAILAGLLKQGDGKDFDELAQKLINLCGPSFVFECTPKTFVTLKNDFVANLPIYRAQKATLIEHLGITDEEKLSLDILNQYVVRVKSNKTHLWEKLGISRGQYYRRRKLARPSRVSRFMEKCIAILCPRQKNSVYYEGGSGTQGRERGVRDVQRIYGIYGGDGDVRSVRRNERNYVRGNCVGRVREGIDSGGVENERKVFSGFIVYEVVERLEGRKVLLVGASGGLERFEMERPPPWRKGRKVFRFSWKVVFVGCRELLGKW